MSKQLMGALCAVTLLALSANCSAEDLPAARRQPVARDCSAPIMPKAALRYELEGKTVLEFDINDAGRADHVRVLRSSGWELLDAASVRALNSCKFDAAPDDGQRRSGFLQSFEWTLAPEPEGLPDPAELVQGSCRPSGRFTSFTRSPRGDTRGDGLLVRFLVSPLGEPFGVKTEGAQDASTVEDVDRFIKSCRFTPASRNGKPVPGSIYGRIRLKDA